MVLGSRTPADEQRRQQLDFLRGGDIRSSRVDVYGVDRSRGEIIDIIVKALVPRALKIFPRQRWLTCDDSVREAALLFGFHHIFARAVPLWLDSLKAAEQKKAIADGDANGAGWDLVVRNEEEEGEEARPAGANAWVE